MSSQDIVFGGLSGRYATALFELADAENQLDQVANDLELVSEVLVSSEDLRRLIRSPVISRKDQQIAMNLILSKMKVSSLTLKFVGVIAENRRLDCIGQIIKAFQALIADRRGEVTAEVVSAVSLSNSQIGDLRKVLEKISGKQVTVSKSVSEDLLGGLIVKMGSRMVDSSLKTKLNKLRFAMKGIG